MTLSCGLKTLFSAPGNWKVSLPQHWMAHFVSLIHWLFNYCRCSTFCKRKPRNKSYINLGCCRSVACQQNIIWHLYSELFELVDLALACLASLALSQSREALFALKQEWEYVEKRAGRCYPMDRGEATISPAQLYSTARCEHELVWICLAMHFFFISIYLWFICFSKTERTSRLLPL